MTDLQDSILDRLVGTRVGVNWPDGPLAIAAGVVGGKKPVTFGQTDFDRAAKTEIARRLGYPVILCEAIQGANRGLKAEHDRKQLAITLFGTIPIGGPIPKLSVLAQNRVALQLANRVHRYGCHLLDCPAVRVLGDLTRAPAVTREMAAAAVGTRCGTTGGSLRQSASGYPAEMALRGFETRKSVPGWCSVRESARLAAAERGVVEAVDCCLEIARLCEMPV